LKGNSVSLERARILATFMLGTVSYSSSLLFLSYLFTTTTTPTTITTINIITATTTTTTTITTTIITIVTTTTTTVRFKLYFIVSHFFLFSCITFSFLIEFYCV
jgi:hypothetical protein